MRLGSHHLSLGPAASRGGAASRLVCPLALSSQKLEGNFPGWQVNQVVPRGGICGSVRNCRFPDFPLWFCSAFLPSSFLPPSLWDPRLDPGII